MKAILVGAGGLGRELIKRLGDHWVVTVVDTDPVRLALAQELRSVPTIEGGRFQPSRSEACRP